MVNSKVLFYCHYPDKLLSTNRGSLIMRSYRLILDTVEELTTGMAQTIVVNSEFTQKVFRDNFTIIGANHKKEEGSALFGLFGVRKHCPRVLYPPINRKVFEKTPGFSMSIDDLLGKKVNKGSTRIMTSLNRYERKKNIPLALKAFANYLKRTSEKTGKTWE